MLTVSLPRLGGNEVAGEGGEGGGLDPRSLRFIDITLIGFGLRFFSFTLLLCMNVLLF